MESRPRQPAPVGLGRSGRLGAIRRPSRSRAAVPTAPADRAAAQPLIATVLLSDGAHSTGEMEPLPAAAGRRALGVPIYTIALGTANGVVAVPDDHGEMHTLNVPPDTETLAAIASITGAIAFDAPTAEELRGVYDNLQSRIGFTEERQEVTFALVGAGLLLVLGGAGLSAMWFGRLP